MCRALLNLGQPVLLDNLLYQPDSALIRQSYVPKMLHTLNLAGFGLRAWDPASPDPQRPFSYYSQSLPVFDRNLQNLAQKIRPSCVLGHVRGPLTDNLHCPAGTAAGLRPYHNAETALPEDRYGVLFECRIDRDHAQIFQPGLGDQHAIERILVGTR